ncbi:hypothetical protein JTB14_012906 [Gonioctena quinquepunctata]|nr:hypothetical protein JTB14_012906 [Gonioctena quinquepunctata]
MRTSKQDYNKKQIEKKKDDAKNLWKTISDMSGEKQNSEKITKILNPDNRLTENDFETIEAFVEFFTKLAQALPEKLSTRKLLQGE